MAMLAREWRAVARVLMVMWVLSVMCTTTSAQSDEIPEAWQSIVSDGAPTANSPAATSRSGGSFLDTLADLCAVRSGESVCTDGTQFCQSHGECPSGHVCSCVRGCSRLQCTLIQGGCKALPSPANGYSIQHDGFTHFGCKKGFTLTGPSKKTCENGIWSPVDDFPRCMDDGMQEPATCSPSPCENGGMCEAVPTTATGFVCKCPLGFDGTHCQTAWLQKAQYIELLSEVAELRDQLSMMGRRLAEVESCCDDTIAEVGGTVVAINPTEVPLTTLVDELTTGPPPTERQTSPPISPATMQEVKTTIATALLPPGYFSWPTNVVRSSGSSPSSISLLLPPTVTQELLIEFPVALLQRQYVFQIQDWSPWTVVVNTTLDILCMSAVCHNYTIAGLQPLTRYQFAVTLASANTLSQSVADLEIVELPTTAVGAPVWSSDPFLDAESSPVSAVLLLPKSDISQAAMVMFYSLSYRQRGTDVWSDWRLKDGNITASQSLIEVDGLLKSAEVQFIVTAHFPSPTTTASRTASSTVVSVTLPREVYTFPRTAIAPHQIQYNSLMLNLPTVADEYEVDTLGVFVRYLVTEPSLYSTWLPVLRLPATTAKYRLFGLQPGRAYQLRTRGLKGQTPVQYSGTLSFSTPSLSTPVWSIVSIADRTPTSITINLPKVDASWQSSVQYYHVNYHIVTHRPVAATGWQNGPGPLLSTVTTAVLAGLEPNTRYDIRVRAVVLGGQATVSAVLPAHTLSNDSPVWLESAFDDVMARSASVVVNVPITSTSNSGYMVNMRRWINTGMWAEWNAVVNFTIDGARAQRVRTSLADNGRKYIPVRIGPLLQETYYQVTVQYTRGSHSSSLSAVRTTKTLRGGTPAWFDRPVLSASTTSVQLRMPRVLNGYRNITTHYSVEYRFASGHVAGDMTSQWRSLGRSLSPLQEIVSMVGLPAGGTVEVRARAHSTTSSSWPSPAFRIHLPLSDVPLSGGQLSTVTPATTVSTALYAGASSALRSSCLRLCCSFAASLLHSTGACQLLANVSPLHSAHMCRVRFPDSMCVSRLGQCCRQIRV